MTGDLKVKESWLTENVSPAPLRFCHPEKEATEITVNFVPRLVYSQLLSQCTLINRHLLGIVHCPLCCVISGEWVVRVHR